jgi:hypothetical protein
LLKSNAPNIELTSAAASASSTRPLETSRVDPGEPLRRLVQRFVIFTIVSRLRPGNCDLNAAIQWKAHSVNSDSCNSFCGTTRSNGIRLPRRKAYQKDSVPQGPRFRRLAVGLSDRLSFPFIHFFNSSTSTVPLSFGKYNIEFSRRAESKRNSHCA